MANCGLPRCLRSSFGTQATPREASAAATPSHASTSRRSAGVSGRTNAQRSARTAGSTKRVPLPARPPATRPAANDRVASSARISRLTCVAVSAPRKSSRQQASDSRSAAANSSSAASDSGAGRDRGGVTSADRRQTPSVAADTLRLASSKRAQSAFASSAARAAARVSDAIVETEDCSAASDASSSAISRASCASVMLHHVSSRSGLPSASRLPSRRAARF
mmetsp:Transcript_26252/g.80795  ORF Transcript_26252/g.80795 Transcript_26252/m.80795 type:complete len:222 (-) Transcript_26252:232-897(-)